MLSHLPFYQTYQLLNDAIEPARKLAKTAAGRIDEALPDGFCMLPGKMMVASWEIFAFLRLTHERPPFGIPSVKVGRREIAVTEEVITSTPFCDLVHFKKDCGQPQPRVLIVAPMSGHFATLVRNTIETLLGDHDVYITDWLNIRNIPLEAGPFGLDQYIEHVIHFLEFMGDNVHVLGVCQPAVPALIATAVMAEDQNPAQPRSMVLMAGPIDTRINPTTVNKLAIEKPIEWFERNVIGTVPKKFPGAGRRVYPGFLQITAFMSMNVDRHFNSVVDLFTSIVNGNKQGEKFTRDFYEEYFAMMDMSAEFYLETVRKVFQEFHLARGIFEYKGRLVKPELIRKSALFTVEGERDDICSLGQTLAAQDLCSKLRPYKRVHHMQAGVGHYGVFSGRRWQTEVYPLVRNFILQWE